MAKRANRAKVLTALCAVTCWWALSAAPSTAAEAGVVFAEEEKIDTSCSKLAEEGGLPFTISNQTAGEAEGVPVSIELDLLDEKGGESAPDLVCGGLSVEPEETTIPPGKSKVVRLTAADPEGKGEVSGSIVLDDRSGQVVRRALSISAEAEASTIAPLVSSVSADFGSGKEPIWIPVKGSREEVVAALGKEVVVTLGAVSGPGGQFRLLYAGAEQMGAQTAKVKVELDGDPSAGTYSGEIDLSPEAEGGEVTVEVKASDGIVPVILLLLGGIILGLVLQWLAGNLIPRGRLLARIENLSGRAKAAETLVKEAAEKEGWGALELEGVDQLQTELETKIGETMAKKSLVIQIEKPIIEANESAITATETQIDLLKELPAHAKALKAALGLPKIEIPGLEKERIKRTLEAKAEALLGKGSVGVAALKPRLEQMDARALQLASLRELEGRLGILWEEVGELGGRVSETEEIQIVKEILREALRCLVSADEEEELDEAADLLRTARDELIVLRGKAGEPRSSFGAFGGAERTGADRAATAGTVGIEALVPALPESPPTPALLTRSEASRVIKKARRAQWAVVAVSAGLTLVSGLLALYFGKNWALDWQNALTAATWGAATQAVLGTLVASLNDLGSLLALRK